MMGRILTEKDVEAAVKGGSVYAAGGGGWADHGRMLGYAAVSIGKPELVSIDELDDNDWVATAAAIGAPASTTPWEMRGVDYVKAVELLQEALGEKVSALMVFCPGSNGIPSCWWITPRRWPIKRDGFMSLSKASSRKRSLSRT
jgi:DUF917 family protein